MNLTSRTTGTIVVLCALLVATAATASAQSDNNYRVTASTLNVRSGPSTSNGKVGALKRGEVVQIESIQNDWAAIKLNGDTRYVYAGYLEKVASPAAPTSSSSATYETTTDLNLRSGPSTKNRIVAVMPQGARVTSVGASGGWLQVSYAGTTGYAYGDYLRPIATPTPATPRPTPTRPTRPATPSTSAHVASYRVKTPYSVARAAPSRSAVEITRLRRGDRFRSTRSALSGYYIGFTFKGRTAWVVKTSLEREESLNALDTKTGKATLATLFRLKVNQDLRAGPTDAKKGVKLGRVRRGQIVTGQRHYDPRFFLFRAWRLISVDGRRGWVQARFLERYKPVERPEPVTIDTKSGSPALGRFTLSRTTQLVSAPKNGKATVRLAKGSLVSARRKAKVGFLFKTTWVLVSRSGKTAGWVRASRLRQVR